MASVPGIGREEQFDSSLVDQSLEDVIRSRPPSLPTSVFETAPDKAAQQYRLHKDTGLPMPAIQENEQRVSAGLVQSSLDMELLRRRAPHLAVNLMDPYMAPAIADDTDRLSGIEQTATVARYAGNTIMAGLARIPAGLAGATSAVLGSSSEFLGLAPDFIKSADVLSYMLERASDAAAGSAARFATGSESAAEWWKEDIPMEKLGPTARAALSGFESIGPSANALLITLATRNPHLGASMMGVMAGGEEAMFARDKGLPAVQQLVYGGVQGTIEWLTEIAPAFRFLENTRVGSSFFKTLMDQVKVEIVQEQINTVWNDLNKWIVFNEDRTFGDYLKERPSAAYETLIATITGTGGTVALTAGTPKVLETAGNYLDRRHHENVKKRRAALADDLRRQMMQGEQTVIESLVNEARQSKTLARDPRLFEEVTSRGLGDLVIYLNAGKAQALFQEDSALADEFNAAVPEAAEQMDEALENDGNLALPANKVVAALASNERLAPLQLEMRLSEESMSDDEVVDSFLERASEAPVPELRDVELLAEDPRIQQATVKREAVLEETGETVEYDAPAVEVLNEAKQKVEFGERLMACLRA